MNNIINTTTDLTHFSISDGNEAKRLLLPLIFGILLFLCFDIVNQYL